MNEVSIMVSIITGTALVLGSLLTGYFSRKVRANKENIELALQLKQREDGYVARLEALVKRLEDKVKELTTANDELRLFLKICREERQELVERLAKKNLK